jgi:hypothetical protein
MDQSPIVPIARTQEKAEKALDSLRDVVVVLIDDPQSSQNLEYAILMLESIINDLQRLRVT